MSEQKAPTDRLRENITSLLLDIAENGEPVCDDQGNEVSRKTPSASMVAKMIEWYKYLQSESGSTHDTPLGGLVDRIRQNNGGKLPDLDQESDDPATA